LGRDFLVDTLGALECQRALIDALLGLGCTIRLARQDVARRRQANRRFWIDRARYLRDAGDRRILAWRGNRLLGGGLVEVREAHALHRIEVIQIAPVFLEAVRGRQRVGVIAEMVLAELAGVVAEIEQELGERRGAGPQTGGA